MSNLGSLVLSLEANIVSFQSDMGKAAAMAEKRAAEMDRAFSTVKNTLASLGAVVSFGVAFDMLKSKIEGVIDAEAGLNDLAARTGASAVALSGLVQVIKFSGTSADELAIGMQKLSKSMVDAENGGKKTSASFSAIGLSVADLQGKRPDQVFEMVSKALAGYQDGAGKVVIAQNLLGKSGADLLPVMHNLGIAGEYVATSTQAQINAANELNDNRVRLQASTDAIFRTISNQLVPVFNAFTRALLDSANANDGVRKSVDGLAQDNSIRTWAEDAAGVVGFVSDAFEGVSRTVQVAGLRLGAAAAALAAIKRGEFQAAYDMAGQVSADVDKIMDKPLFSDRLKKRIAESHQAVASAVSAPLAVVPTGNLGNKNPFAGPKDDPAKAYMEGVIKAQDAFMLAEKTQLATREQYLDLYHNLEFFTLRDVEQKKQDLIAANLADTEAQYDKEIEAIKAYIAHAKTLTDAQGNGAGKAAAQDGENRLADAIRKRAAAVTEANKQITDSQDKLYEVQRKFDLGTTETARVQDLANASAQFQIDLMGKSTLEVQRQTAAKQIQLALDERIRLLQKEDPLVDTAPAIAAAAIQTAQAQALITESYNKQRDAIFGAGEALRKYQEDAGNKAAQIESALTNAFKGAEDAAVSFVTTGKGSIKSLVDSVVADITRMIIKEQESKILGGLSSGGGMMGLLGSLIGAVSGTSGIATVASGMGGDSLDNFIGLAGLAGAKASGGPVMGGSSYLVGEKGPEIFTPTGSGTIIPNGSFGGDGPSSKPLIVQNHFTIQGAMDRRTQSQIAASAAAGAQRAMARNT